MVPKGQPDDPRSFDEVLRARLGSLEGAYLDSAVGRSAPTHVPTGLDLLDRLGLGELGVLTTLGGHTGDGKSVARKALAWGAARAGLRVQEYSFEDPAPLAADRVVADLMDVDSVDLRRLRLEHDPENIPALVGRLRAVAREAGPIARRIYWSDAPRTVDALFESIDRHWDGGEDGGGETRLVLIDYAQMFDAEGDEKSTERVIARLAGRCNRLASERWCSVVLFSQVRREVVERGRKWFENARYEASRKGRPLGVEAVQGFRPMDGDLQWSTALGQRSKLVPFIFRPHRWARRLGLTQFQDNVMEWYVDKNNWGQDVQVATLKFDPTRSRLWSAPGAQS